MTPEAIVETAAKERLALAAVTDHDVVTNVQAAVDAGLANGVVVIPGVELSTPEGHLLLYFRTVDHLTSYYNRLEIVDAGSTDSRCQTSMLECLNRIPIDHGFGVLAHVDGGGGFEEKIAGFPPHKADILCHPSLVGIEVVTADSAIHYSRLDKDPQRAQIEELRRARLGAGAQSVLARVLSSDSHSLTALGRNAKGDRRVTRVKMDTPSFDALRIALQDADARVRLEDEIPAAVPFIKGMKIEGGFLDGTTIQFSRNLNCIIGGRGAGKSTAFESVRCVTAQPSKSKLVDSEVWAETIHVVWQDETGQEHTLIRRHGEAPRNADRPDEGPVAFPIDCYGQGETAQTSQQAQTDPAALLQYLDRFVTIEPLQDEEEFLREALLENQSALEKAEVQVARIPQYERLLETTKRQLKVLETAKARDIIVLERKIAEERAVREQIFEAFDELPGELDREQATKTLQAIQDLVDPATLKAGAKQYRAILAQVNLLLDELTDADTAAKRRLEEINPEVAKQLNEWKAQENGIVDRIEKKRKELAEQGIRLDLGYVRKLAKDEASYEKAINNFRAWKPYLQRLRKERKKLLERLWNVRRRIYGERYAFAQRATNVLKGTLHDLEVSVKLDEGGWSPDAERLVQEAMGWRTVQVPRAAALVRGLTAKRLLDCVRRRDANAIRRITAADGPPLFSKADAEEILARLGEAANLFSLERCQIEDLPRITVTKPVIVGGETQFRSRDFARLSLGQQQSVLLALMLSADTSAPLLIDQPEDNLDSEFVFNSLVPVLRRAKERRQVVIVTHNANIAVLGDAELILAVKSVSDHGQIVQRGSIDARDVRQICCQILEGTEDAFRRRARVYGLL